MVSLAFDDREHRSASASLFTVATPVTPVAAIGKARRLPSALTHRNGYPKRCYEPIIRSPKFRPTAGTPTNITTARRAVPGVARSAAANQDGHP